MSETEVYRFKKNYWRLHFISLVLATFDYEILNPCKTISSTTLYIPSGHDVTLTSEQSAPVARERMLMEAMAHRRNVSYYKTKRFKCDVRTILS